VPINVMLDLETLGTAPGCPVISIGACVFDPSGIGDTFYRVVNAESAIGAGLLPDEATINWWEEQTPEARAQTFEVAMSPTGGEDLGKALAEFETWLMRFEMTRGVCVWGNGADFDPPILTAAYRACGWRRPPWRPYAARCYRTLKNFAPSIVPLRSGTKHNALDDALTQARHAIQICDLTGLSEAIFNP
jgi:hypothetical protein